MRLPVAHLVRPPETAWNAAERSEEVIAGQAVEAASKGSSRGAMRQRERRETR